MAIQKFTYYKDIVNYKKSPPKPLDSRMVFSRFHAGLRSYNDTVVQMRFLYTGASTVALICLINSYCVLLFHNVPWNAQTENRRIRPSQGRSDKRENEI